MKYTIAAVFGLLIGAIAAGAALYYNPLTDEGTSAPDGGWAFEYGYPGDGFLLATHRGLKGVPLAPEGIERTWENTIDASLLNVLALRGRGDAPPAVATRLAAPSRSTDLLRNGAIVSDFWLVTVPGQGSFFVHSEDNLWPFLKQTWLPVLLGRPWRGPASYAPTVGPAGRKAAVYGATGRFAAARGTAAETYRLERFGPHGLERLSGTLHVDLDTQSTLADAAADSQ
jgi:hypothetical protein